MSFKAIRYIFFKLQNNYNHLKTLELIILWVLDNARFSKFYRFENIIFLSKISIPML